MPVEATPSLSSGAAAERVRAITGSEPFAGRPLELVWLPVGEGEYRLAWLAYATTLDGAVGLLLDATTGNELDRFGTSQRQSAIGTGAGVLGDPKKMSTRAASGVFLAEDQLRPSPIVTFDMRGNTDRTGRLLFTSLVPTQADVAADADNVWTDGVAVDAHTYVGYTYDYYFARFNRRGVDGRNRSVRSLIHPARRQDVGTDYIQRVYDSAEWCYPCGADGQGYMLFGEGLPFPFVDSNGQRVNFLAAGFDVVAHELSHAVTTYSADLLYQNESGSLNESFSDVMAVGAEYYLVESGRSQRTADYLIGEDVWTPGVPGSQTGIRSLSNPQQFGQPDHYSRRLIGTADFGYVHYNSGISNHAFFLAIEGGTNRTSGLSVQGVGGTNRQQIERIFYRGFTNYLTQTATFAQARQATLRAASELYGDSSAAFRAVQQAWTAVGVN